HHFVARASLGQIAVQFSQRSRSFFALPIRLALDADASNELTEHQGDDEIGAEQNRVLSPLDNECEARWKKKEIPREGAQGPSQQHRSASHEQGKQDDGEEKHQSWNARTGQWLQGKIRQPGCNDSARGQQILIEVGGKGRFPPTSPA